MPTEAKEWCGVCCSCAAATMFDIHSIYANQKHILGNVIFMISPHSNEQRYMTTVVNGQTKWVVLTKNAEEREKETSARGQMRSTGNHNVKRSQREFQRARRPENGGTGAADVQKNLPCVMQADYDDLCRGGGQYFAEGYACANTSTIYFTMSRRCFHHLPRVSNSP